MFKQSARKYLSHGFSVFPVCSNKRPGIPSWGQYQKRLPTSEEMATWEKDFGNLNIAIVTGKLSDLTVVDCDTPEAIEKIEELLPDSLEVPFVTTPRGGRHYYFKFTPELVNKARYRDGIDVRTEGGYVVAWGFALVAPRPAMPAELLTYLLAGSSGPGPRDKETPPLTIGRRDEDLFHAALMFFNDERPREEVERIILDIAKVCKPAFPEKEALAKVESAWKRYRDKSKKTISFVEAKLSDVEEEPIFWLWEDVFPIGMLSIITGNPSVGKTFAAAWIASRLSHGKPFPGRQTGIMGETLYLTRESPQKTVLKPRMVAAGADCSKITHIQGIYDELGQAHVFDVGKNIPLMEQKLSANPEIRLIIIDPIISFMDVKADSNNPIQSRHAMDILAVFADKWKVAIIVIMHLNKNMAQDIIQRNSGSIQFMAAAQVGWVVGPDPDNKFRKLMMPAKNNLAPMTDTWAFDVETYTYQNKGGKTIKTGRAVFLDEPQKDVDVSAIISPFAAVDPSKLSKMRQAQNLLMTEVMRGGPKPQRDLERRAGELNISLNVLRKAKLDLGIDDTHIGQGKGSMSVWFYGNPPAEDENA